VDAVWYFAYGSNLSVDVFRGRRGIEHRRALPGRLHGWRLVFDKPPIVPIGESYANLVADHAAFLELEIQDIVGSKAGSAHHGRSIRSSQHARRDRDVILINQILSDEVPHDAAAALDEEVDDGAAECRRIDVAQLVVHDVIELPREQAVDERRPAVADRMTEQREATRTFLCRHRQSPRSQPAARPA